MTRRYAFSGDHLVTVTMPAKEWDVVLSAIETDGIKTAACMNMKPSDKADLGAWATRLDKAAASIESQLFEVAK